MTLNNNNSSTSSTHHDEIPNNNIIIDNNNQEHERIMSPCRRTARMSISIPALGIESLIVEASVPFEKFRSESPQDWLLNTIRKAYLVKYPKEDVPALQGLYYNNNRIQKIALSHDTNNNILLVSSSESTPLIDNKNSLLPLVMGIRKTREDEVVVTEKLYDAQHRLLVYPLQIVFRRSPLGFRLQRRKGNNNDSSSTSTTTSSTSTLFVTKLTPGSIASAYPRLIYGSKLVAVGDIRISADMNVSQVRALLVEASLPLQLTFETIIPPSIITTNNNSSKKKNMMTPSSVVVCTQEQQEILNQMEELQGVLKTKQSEIKNVVSTLHDLRRKASIASHLEFQQKFKASLQLSQSLLRDIDNEQAKLTMTLASTSCSSDY